MAERNQKFCSGSNLIRSHTATNIVNTNSCTVKNVAERSYKSNIIRSNTATNIPVVNTNSCTVNNVAERSYKSNIIRSNTATNIVNKNSCTVNNVAERSYKSCEWYRQRFNQCTVHTTAKIVWANNQLHCTKIFGVTKNSCTV